MDISLRLATRGVARRVTRSRHDAREDPPWAAGYPMEGDRRACVAYLRQLPIIGGSSRSHPFGYYQILLGPGGEHRQGGEHRAGSGIAGAGSGIAGWEVVGGIGFHGPPRDGVVEIGYGVVPGVRKRGVATESLRQILDLSATMPGVRRVCGRTTPDNLGSQKVMTNCGLRFVGRDPEYLHFEVDLVPGTPRPRPA